MLHDALKNLQADVADVQSLDTFARSRFSLLAEAPWRTGLSPAATNRITEQIHAAATRGFAQIQKDYKGSLIRLFNQRGTMWVHQPQIDLRALKRAAMSKIHLATALSVSMCLPEWSELLPDHSGVLVSYQAAIYSSIDNHAEFCRVEDITQTDENFLADPALIDLDAVVPGISVRYWDELTAMGINPTQKFSEQLTPFEINEFFERIINDIKGDLHHLAAQLGDGELLSEVARSRSLVGRRKTPLEQSVA